LSLWTVRRGVPSLKLLSFLIHYLTPFTKKESQRRLT